MKRTNLTYRLARLMLVIVLASFFISCRNQEKSKALHYPIDSLINAQIDHLTLTKAGLTKIASLDGNLDTISYTPADSTIWKNELGVFSQLDNINKAIYKESYVIQDGLADSKSNLLIRQFEAKESEKKLPIPSLKIYYQGTLGNVRRIEGVYIEENELYKSTRILSIELQDIHNKTVLTSYTIKGNQKMILADSMEFSVDARININ